MREDRLIGKSLSHYRIIEKLGAGGMGEVYCAEDENLHRRVAIKVLPDVFAGDPERLARFEREAKVLGTLNHPNIASIHSLEEAQGKRFLVLEYVEGETLAERLSKGALPFEEALDICHQIAVGLEGAHEKGIIHRDLKPSNVKITPEGKVKILDFGLAKALLGQASTADIAHSPTITAEMTQPGVILGTAAYMSPEQAKGKIVDKRADIWAFGCVLFECLTGKRAFGGESITEIIAKIIEAEPPWASLPQTTPPSICALLRRCLQKDRNRRAHDIADVRIEIEEALTAPAEVAPVEAAKASRWRLPLLVAGMMAAAAIIGLLVINLRIREGEPRPVARFTLALPSGLMLTSSHGEALALSPDGSQLAYATRAGLYLRRLDKLEASLVSGTDGFRQVNCAAPFFSPDGKWIAFFADYKLYKVPAWGGLPKALCNWGGTAFGASWAPDDTIIFGQGSLGIWRVPADGGEPKILVAPDPDKRQVFHGPQLIKDGKWLLFTLGTLDAPWDDAQIVVQSLETKERITLIQGGRDARYLPTGHVIYARQQKLLAVPFNLETLTVTGDPVEVIDDIFQVPYVPFSQVSLSKNGTLVHLSGSSLLSKRNLVWADRKGQISQAVNDLQPFGFPALSSDGKRVAVSLENRRGGRDIWVYDLSGRTAPLLLVQGGCNWDPVWTPDGRGIVYSSGPTCRSEDDLYWIPADGSGRQPVLLLDRPNRQYPYSFDTEGNLLFCDYQFDKGWDVFVLEMKGKREVRPLLDSEFTEWQPVVSPDGRWIAYASTESGSEEVYVASYPELRAKKRISFEGGGEPRWSHDGRELFYRNGNKIMAVVVEPGLEFSHLAPKRLFEGNFWGAGSWPTYNFAPDGRFLLIQEGEAIEGATPRIFVVINWFEELKRLVPRRR